MRILLSTTVSALLMCSALAQTEDDRISATGSGFFVTPDGYFITNDHVIRGAATVRIVQNGNKINAKIIRTDPANDLAVLKAEGEFVFVRLGASRNVRLGQNVFTIGFPNPQIQGVAPKLTTGVISATTGIRDDPRLLQISIPVQPGNSGGPVIDENGDAVGVVSASLSALGLLRMSGSLPQNVNYAVKSSYVTALLEDVLPAETSRESASAAHNQAEIMAAAEKAVALVLSYAAPSRKSAVATDKEDRPPLSEAPPEVAANPHLGTWKLNEAKSTLVPGKNTTVVYGEQGDKIKVTVNGVDKDGKPTHGVWVGKWDGKAYPTKGNLSWTSAAYTVVNDRTNDMTAMKDGKIVWSGRITVSADGKSRTVTVNGTDAKGKKFSGKSVYDKE